MSNVQATKVLFGGKDGKQAVGVEFSRNGKNGKPEQLKASKEVILSAGVINTPQLLKLSGVGPAAELAEHNIPLVHELVGVGENLQDHPDVIVRYLSKAGGTLNTSLSLETIRFLKKVLFEKNFIYTPTDSGGFIKSSPEEPIPDLQLQFGSVRMEPHGDGIFTSMRSGYVLHVCHMRPESRGRVTLASNDPFAAPKIEANRSEEHTSELQSRPHLVCRLLLEKKKK